MLTVECRRSLVMLALLGALGACRDDSSRGSRTVNILALGGDQPEPGVTVISHAADGAVIDRVNADAVGRATLGVDDGALVSIVFPGTITTLTPVVSVVTTVAPPGDDLLTIVGPDRSGPPALIVGVLEINGPTLPGADYFEVDVGCATVRVTSLPEFIDIGACSLGSDTTLDVLARGYHDLGGDPPAPVLDGYAAGRAEMVGGRAVLDLPAWQTSGTPIPVTAESTPTVLWTLLADDVPFIESELIVGDAFAYANLAVDRTEIQAVRPAANGARVTDRFVDGVPSSIALSDEDFLPAFDGTTELVDDAPASVRWSAAPSSIDAVHLHATWAGTTAYVVPGSHRVVWDAVLPPGATGASLPALDDDLGATLAGAGAITQVDIVLRHIDSSDLADFAALQTAGIHAEETLQASRIVPRPMTGQVRVAHVQGLR